MMKIEQRIAHISQHANAQRIRKEKRLNAIAMRREYKVRSCS